MNLTKKLIVMAKKYWRTIGLTVTGVVGVALLYLAVCPHEINIAKTSLISIADVTIPSTITTKPEPEEETGERYHMGTVPQLPAFTDSLRSSIPDHWTLHDFAEFDYNGDGLMDVVGVLDRCDDDDNVWYPRILFVARRTTDNHYFLDFQDINLVRARNEGGAFGDPYEPLTAEKNTFTLNTYGGSAWKWSESTTFEYRNKGWYLAQESDRYGYGPLTTSLTFNDYRTGIGKRYLNNDDFESMEAFSESIKESFDLEYEVKLDAAPTLYEASQRWWLTPERLTIISVKNIRIAAGIELKPSDVTLPIPEIFSSVQHMNEVYIVYIFDVKDNTYLAVYDCRRQDITVIAKTPRDRKNDTYAYLKVYKNKIYYSETISATMKIKKDTEITESEEHIYTQIIRMNLDGTKKEVLFRYDNDYKEGEILEDYLPYISASCTPLGGELIVSLYIGDAPNKYYRMNLDGTNVRFIGELKGS